MKIGLRGGHSPRCKGAMGILDEQIEVRKIYNEMVPLLQAAGHTIIHCNSDADTISGELSEGTNKANSNNCDIYVTIHMNASGGIGNGTEVWMYNNANSTMNGIASRICQNFAAKGFQNRGVKYNTAYHDLNASIMPAMIVETLFCDNQYDVDLYKRFGINSTARFIANAIDAKVSLTTSDNSIPPEQNSSKVEMRVQKGTDDQRFYIEDAENDYVRLKNKKTGLYLDVPAADAKNDAVLQLYEKNNTDAQLWKIIYKSHGYAQYALLEPKLAPDKYASVENNGIDEGAKLKLWDDLKNSKQKFWTKQANDGTYVFVHVYSLKAITAV
ncbi:MAG: N-acetylmuramoyl-L-alanine amidase [Ruminococcus sp.]|nr:N-acetylmuramoyl-L-alanine amidase [Ruminococcus sp.]